MILLNLFFEGGNANLVFRTEAGRKILSEPYNPHFFALCDTPEEKAWLFSQHPMVLSTKIENGAVKITTGMKDFGQVISDIRKIPGVKELAETSVPHYFRYIDEKKLVFFQDYDDSLRPVGSHDEIGNLSRLRLGVIVPDARYGYAVYGENEIRDDVLGASAASHLTKTSEFDQKSGLDRIDVVFSNGGDDFLRNKKGVITTFAGCLFRETVHIDVKQDMAHDIYDESLGDDLLKLGRERLVRIMELSYMTSAKPDMVSRITPGKLNVFLHMAAAKRNGMIIPDTKKSVEKPKSLRTLRLVDKGGTIFYPKPGVYEKIAKCDFASMYPNIIVRYNISSETMHCGCDDYHEVPWVGWRICKKPGLIPQGLEAVLERRLALKKLMKAEPDPARKKAYDLRQKALKNILVCSFGYLGFKNFIFSNVECKECVMLYGRHILERTKRMAEDAGLEVVYGMVDSLFLKGGSDDDYRAFANRASAEMGFELEIDCIFERIAFPSGSDGGGVANKYYGIAQGKIEARGIAVRHSDSPRFIKEFQEKAIFVLLSGTGDRDERLRLLVQEYERKITYQKIPLADLAITKAIRQDSYKHGLAHVKAYRLMKEKRGAVTFVFTMDGPKPLDLAQNEVPDAGAYTRLLHQAEGELLLGLHLRASDS